MSLERTVSLCTFVLNYKNEANYETTVAGCFSASGVVSVLRASQNTTRLETISRHIKIKLDRMILYTVYM